MFVILSVTKDIGVVWGFPTPLRDSSPSLRSRLGMTGVIIQCRGTACNALKKVIKNWRLINEAEVNVI
jgi:hypothetical protein